MLLNLPLPPSVNAIYKTTRTGRTYLSKEAKNYKKEILYLCQKNKFNIAINYLIELDIKIFKKNKRERDVDNYLKITFDSLQDAGVFQNDNLIKKLTIEEIGIDKDNPRLEVGILPYLKKYL